MSEQLQRIARFVWAPFVARLLMEGRLTRGPYPVLPVDDPGALTSDTVADVREIVRRGVWAYLVRQGGWRRTRFVDPARDRVSEGRLWEAPHLQPPAFSPGSIQLLLLLFNATRSPPRKAPGRGMAATPAHGRRLELAIDLPLDLSKSGDVLLHHVVFRRLVAVYPHGGPWTRRFAANPLNLLTHAHLFEVETSRLPPSGGTAVRESLARLLDDDFHPFLPWLAHDWVREWSRFEPERLRTRDSLRVSCQRQGRIWETWMHLLLEAERYDILVPLVAFWARLDPFSALRGFERLAGDCRLEQRTELARPWVELLELGSRLHQTAEEVRGLHPVDRQAVHQLFLTACGEHDFDGAATRIDRLVQGLRPSLG